MVWSRLAYALAYTAFFTLSPSSSDGRSSCFWCEASKASCTGWTPRYRLKSCCVCALMHVLLMWAITWHRHSLKTHTLIVCLTFEELRNLLSLACRQQTESYTINTRVYLLLSRLAWLSNCTKEKSLSFTWVFGTVPSAVSPDAHTVYIVQYKRTDYTGCVLIFSVTSCAFC